MRSAARKVAMRSRSARSSRFSRSVSFSPTASSIRKCFTSADTDVSCSAAFMRAFRYVSSSTITVIFFTFSHYHVKSESQLFGRYDLMSCDRPRCLPNSFEISGPNRRMPSGQDTRDGRQLLPRAAERGIARLSSQIPYLLVDTAHSLCDVLRRLALDRQKGGKPLGKIGTLAVQTQRRRQILPHRLRADRSMGDAG